MPIPAKIPITAPAITPAFDFFAFDGVVVEPEPEPEPEPEFLLMRGAKRFSIEFDENPSMGAV